MIQRALISVSDKTGIVEVARRLHAKGVTILSTGGTAQEIERAGIPVIPVEEVTKFPECFGGRVKTMHPLIMGGVLFRRDNADDVRRAEELGVEPIDLVIVNLYPFEEAVRGCHGEDTRTMTTNDSPLARPRGDRQHNDLIELIDIGGPTLLRSAAKNFAHVTVVTDPADYERVISQIASDGDTSLDLRTELAAKVFARTAAYDSCIAEELSGGAHRGIIFTNERPLRYGENPHQWGTFYELRGQDPGWVVLQEEKQMSYLNLLDADGAWNLVAEFGEPTAACIKHANPSGVASHANIAEAFQRAYDADRLSAFGVIIALNRTCTGDVIRKIIDQKIFAEIIIAPSYEEEAVALLKKKPKLRVIEIKHQTADGRHQTFRTALGGMLVQEEDTKTITEADLTSVTSIRPTASQIKDLLFAWKIVKHAKSNAIVFTKDCISVGIGCGQTSRVDSTWIAAKRAGERAKGAAMASDAFFPFPDSIEEAAKHGISAIIQPGGSIRDAEVFAKAEELGICMVTTGIRAFKH